MGKGGGSAADVTGAALETGEQARILNEAQTFANRPGQSNPWGQTSWEVTPVWDPVNEVHVNTWQQTESLNAPLQASLEAQQGVQQGRSELARAGMGRVYDEMSQPMDFDQYGNPIQMGEVGELQDFNYDVGEQRQIAEDAAYQRATSRLDPQFASRESDLQNRLRNQGLAPGDQAYDSAMSNLGRERTDAYDMARLGSVSEGRSEQQLGYGQALQQAQFGAQQQQQGFGQNVQQTQIANQLRQQQMQEDLFARGYSLDEVNTLLAGQGIGGGPPTSGGQTQTIAQGLLSGES